MGRESKNILRIGVTGHRKLTPEQSAAIKPVIKKAIENIMYYHQDVYGDISDLVVTSSIAEGADSIFAMVALENFDCKLILLLPFEEEEYLKDFKSEEARKQFKYLVSHDKVSEVICVNKISSGERNELYLDAGKKVVDQNDYMIAVWNEEKAAGTGGTGDVVEYAAGLDKNILVLNPYSDSLSINGMYLPEFKTPGNVNSIREKSGTNFVDNFFNIYDKAAVYHQSLYKKIWSTCFNLGLIAALVFSMELAFKRLPLNIQLLLNFIGLLCIISITILISIEKKKSLHRKYLTNRFIAERLRLDKLFMECGIYPHKTEGKLIHRPALEFETLPPLVSSNKLTQLCAYSGAPISEKQSILKGVVQEQCIYHRGRIKRLLKTEAGNSLLTKVLFIFSVSLIIITILYELNEGTGFINFSESRFTHFFIPAIVFLSLFIPALIARFEARKYLSEWRRMITQSEYMLGYFEELSEKIDGVENDDDLPKIINTLNENMYLENLEWEIFMLNKNEIPS